MPNSAFMTGQPYVAPFWAGHVHCAHSNFAMLSHPSCLKSSSGLFSFHDDMERNCTCCFMGVGSIVSGEVSGRHISGIINITQCSDLGRKFSTVLHSGICCSVCWVLCGILTSPHLVNQLHKQRTVVSFWEARCNDQSG